MPPSSVPREVRDPRWKPVETELDAALKSLEELRRLFFSLVEHLRETAQRQADLNDRHPATESSPPESQTAEKIGPLANRQSQLQQFTQTLASALSEQSQQAVQPTGPPGSAQATGAGTDESQAAAAKEASEKLAQAAELVDTSQKAMDKAAKELACANREVRRCE